MEYNLSHSSYFAFCLTFAFFTISNWIILKHDHRVTKNKLTLQPYLYMTLYFFVCIAVDVCVIDNINGNGVFNSLATSYIYEGVYFLKLMMVLMAFGT
jgi:hypothetical protein